MPGLKCRSCKLQPTLILASLLMLWDCPAPAAVVSVIPEADAFVRSATPTENYGGAGAIAVSGSAAVNATNQQNGLFDSLLRFPMSDVVASLDATLGTHDWVVLRATLHLTEMGAPPAPMFNRGVGAFEVFWIGADDWIEGTGIPLGPTTDGVTWNDLPSLLNAATEVSLGRFTNSGTDAALSFGLGLAEPFIADLRSGTRVTLHLTAASPQIGFTADSRTFFNSNNFPRLEIEAVPNPGARLEGIKLLGTNISLSFSTISNWNCKLQATDALGPGLGQWTNLLTLPAQSTVSNVIFLHSANSHPKFYRLSLSP